MRVHMNTLMTFLHSIGGRKVQFNYRSTQLPNIFARRNPHIAARSASLRAARSMGRIRNTPPHNDIPHSTDAKHTANSHGNDHTTQHQHYPLRSPPPLRRSNTVLLPPPATHPKPPGAFEPSFAVPGFPLMDANHLPALIRRKLFVDALLKGREALRQCAREQRRAAAREAQARPYTTEATKARAQASRRRVEADAEFVRLLERDLKKARAAHDRAEQAEYLRLLGEDLKRAQAAHRRAVDEEFARLLAEERRKAQEAQRRAEEEAARKEMERRRRQEEEKRRKEAEAEERRRKAQEEEWRRKAAEEEERRRRAERDERARKEQGRDHPFFFQKPPHPTGAETAYVQADPKAQLGIYEVYKEQWAMLRNTAIVVGPLRFIDFPWPSFWKVSGVEDITVERVREFVCHPLHACALDSPKGPKGTLSEMLRWHPDKFGKVLEKVVEGDRNAVKEAAENLARILTQLHEEVR